MKVTPKSGQCMGRIFDAVQLVKIRKNGNAGGEARNWNYHICIWSDETRWLPQAKVDDYVKEYEDRDNEQRIVEVKKPDGQWYRLNVGDYIIRYDTFLYGILTHADFKKRYKAVFEDKTKKNKVGI